MLSRRTRALIEFGVSVLGLYIQIRLWKRLLDDIDDWDEPTRPSVSGLAAGALWEVGWLWLRDHDVGSIRTNPYRGILVGICRQAVNRRLFPQTKAFKNNVGIGKTAGRAGYRLWYGVIRPLPGTDE